MDLTIDNNPFRDFVIKRAQGDPRLRAYVHLFAFSECVLPPAQVYTVSIAIRYSDNRSTSEIVSVDYRLLLESPAPELLVYSRIEDVMVRMVKRGCDERLLLHANDAERLFAAVHNADRAFEE